MDIVLGDDHVLKATGVGIVPILHKVPKETQSCTLLAILHIPDLVYHLFITSKATNEGKVRSFNKQNFVTIIGGQIGVTILCFGSVKEELGFSSTPFAAMGHTGSCCVLSLD